MEASITLHLGPSLYCKATVTLDTETGQPDRFQIVTYRSPRCRPDDEIDVYDGATVMMLAHDIGERGAPISLWHWSAIVPWFTATETALKRVRDRLN